MSIGTWVAILVIVAIAIHVTNKYTVVERVSTALVFLVTAFAVFMVFLLRATEFAWTLGDVAGGMRFQIALGSMGVALAMFGLTGVGAGEITAYTHWCVEKGYAAWTGPERRIRGVGQARPGLDLGDEARRVGRLVCLHHLDRRLLHTRRRRPTTPGTSFRRAGR